MAKDRVNYILLFFLILTAILNVASSNSDNTDKKVQHVWRSHSDLHDPTDPFDEKPDKRAVKKGKTTSHINVRPTPASPTDEAVQEVENKKLYEKSSADSSKYYLNVYVTMLYVCTRVLYVPL